MTERLLASSRGAKTALGEELLFRSVVFASVAFAFPLPASAQATIWRTLTANDEPDAVKVKLEAMPEIKRVKIKTKRGVAEGLDVNMNGPGFRIFDGEFSLSVSFKEGRLTEARLINGMVCARDAFPLYHNIGRQLAEKYVKELTPLADRLNFDRAMLESDTARASILSSAWTNGETTAVLYVRFEQTSPPRYIGGSALNRSMYQLSRSIYDNAAAGCGGAFYRTAKIEVVYMSKTEFDERLATIRSEADTASKAAADAL